MIKLFTRQYWLIIILNLLLFPSLYSQKIARIKFKHTGSDQYWTVPSGVTKIFVKAWGGGGAGGNYVFNDIGGGGGFVSGFLTVVPGGKLKIIVGGGGQTGAGPGAYGGGGGKESGNGGRGGGRSAVRNSAGTELITAGAGGGGGGVALANQVGGHAGGGLSGQPGGWPIYDGGPGTQTKGGDAGRSPTCPYGGDCIYGGMPGAKFTGGFAGKYDNGFNGSGGGGYYGGGSGTDVGDGAGGGGSSFKPLWGRTVSGYNQVPGNKWDCDYAYHAGWGGAKAAAGNPGLVVILFKTVCARPSNTQVNSADVKADGQIDISDIDDPVPGDIIAQDMAGVSVYPNPGNGNLTATFKSLYSGKAEMKVFDMLGRSVFHKMETINKGNNIFNLNLSSLRPGNYLLELMSGEQKQSVKFIIKK